MTEDQIRGLFAFIGIPVSRIWQLPNGYMGPMEPLSDEQVVKDSPGDNGIVINGRDQTSGVVRHWMNDYRWRHERPAWLVKTKHGLIQITPRKRVTDICWAETPIRAIVTSDDVTKDETRVHAYTDEKMLEYLNRWAALAAGVTA